MVDGWSAAPPPVVMPMQPQAGYPSSAQQLPPNWERKFTADGRAYYEVRGALAGAVVRWAAERGTAVPARTRTRPALRGACAHAWRCACARRTTTTTPRIGSRRPRPPWRMSVARKYTCPAALPRRAPCPLRTLPREQGAAQGVAAAGAIRGRCRAPVSRRSLVNLGAIAAR